MKKNQLSYVKKLALILEKYFPNWQSDLDNFDDYKLKAHNILGTMDFLNNTKMNMLQTCVFLEILKQYGLTEEQYEELSERRKEVNLVMLKIDDEFFPYIDWVYLFKCVTLENIADATEKVLKEFKTK